MAAANLVIDTHARKRNIAKKFVYRTIGPYLQLNIWGVGEPRLVTVDIFEPKGTSTYMIYSINLHNLSFDFSRNEVSVGTTGKRK